MATAHSDSAAGRALWLSTVAFAVCFAVWTIFSIIGVQIKKDLGLTDTEFGLLVGTPVLTGAMNDFVGVWTSCFMLLFLVVAASLLWMHFAILRMQKRQVPQFAGPQYFPEADVLGQLLPERLSQANGHVRAPEAKPSSCRIPRDVHV